jgi:hypothetical protein
MNGTSKYGDVILTPDKKFPVQSPYLAIANKAQEQMVKIMIEFGMTPSSRSRVHTTPLHGPSALALYRAARDAPLAEPDAEPDSIEEAIQQQMAILDADQKDREAQEAEACRFFAPRPSPAEALLERANRAREGPLPKSHTDFSKVCDENGADQIDSSCD